jgi:hypothetical protein
VGLEKWTYEGEDGANTREVEVDASGMRQDECSHVYVFRSIKAHSSLPLSSTQGVLASPELALSMLTQLNSGPAFRAGRFL